MKKSLISKAYARQNKVCGKHKQWFPPPSQNKKENLKSEKNYIKEKQFLNLQFSSKKKKVFKKNYEIWKFDC